MNHTQTDSQTRLEGYKAIIRKMKMYEEAAALIYWDMRTGAPKKGIEARSEVVGELSTETFRMSVSDEMGAYLDWFTQPEELAKLTPIERKMIQESKKDYDRSKKIPADKYQAYVVLTSQAEAAWEEARAQSDYAAFQPYLEKIIATTREFIELWGYEGNKYNTLLDMYEPGMTVEKLDAVFGALREQVVPLLQRLQAAADQPEHGFLQQDFAKEKQKQFSLYILQQMHYDFDAGRLDETVHPFATALSRGDVRITTRYLPQDVGSALFGTIHEGGHALYEQNIAKELEGTNLCTGTSMGIHESQSRFWENVIGRSPQFWSRYFGDLQAAFPGQLDDVDADAFYRAINRVEPSLIRVEADELTYNLHIMIRYELEKALINGELETADLPAAWNAKYKEYLGVEPQTDSEGVLQDVHWSSGAFGYFPSYALGNMYAAQIAHTLRKQLPELDALVARGELAPIKEWLTEKVYRHGKLLTPGEIVLEATGEELNPAYLVDYLRSKYEAVYKL
ncbi:carboxypeptidase M32 [Paenibacillus athensensis]|uniref:Metal-dependent carboxypeptidase n=1 Tax=Paenibacillus athensensis TaxID=1967502 RepID=A0A4Y8Q8I4_9BACL|nr:carboxypeptidase M32 [Paenibacillus athensensis]MCD1257337.1 carboxypeptidase M32 [Paenibacillus athensensis]